MKGVAVATVLLAVLAVPASAGDRRLPEPPVTGIEPCGPQGFRLPGSDGCLRLSGSVAAETVLRRGGGGSRGRDGRSASRAEGRVAADLRVPTDLGPLRLYGELRARRGF